MITLDDFEEYAQANLPKIIYDHIKSGAAEEQTLTDNKEAFKRYRLRPQVLRDVSKRDMSTSLLGHRIPFPIAIQATAAHKMSHHQGEIATARAAASVGTIMVLSSWSSINLEDVVSAVPSGIKWFQLYVTKERRFTKNLVKRAEKAGYQALVVTIDTTYAGRKYADERNNFAYPAHIRIANFDGDSAATPTQRYRGPELETALTWETIDWLVTFTSLPVIVKGVLTAKTARESLQHGVSAIIVSNHGGRQLDGVLSTIEALPEVVEAVQGADVEVYLDGGVRKGTDVLKALAIGAKAVFVGRPVVWGLVHDGESGARKVLEMLRDEFSLAMALTGCASLSDIKPSMVVKGPYLSARL